MRFAWWFLGGSVLAGAIATLLPDWRWIFLLAIPVGLLASLVLLLPPRERSAAPSHVIVDGSNVIYWDGGTPSLKPILALLGDLAAKGMTPGVIFDANAGYKIGDRYLDDRAFASLLGLHTDSVFVVPRGTQADQYILDAARKMRARIVTNDRFRDWEDRYPEVRGAGLLIRGGYRDGALWLDAVVQRAEA
jgi:hypothetical protein